MKPNSHLGARGAFLLTVSLAALTMAACNKSGEPTPTAAVNVAAPPATPLPLDAGAPPAGPSYAPGAAALPPVPPVRIAPQKPRPERYAYVNRASQLNSAFGDSPPDYAVDY